MTSDPFKSLSQSDIEGYIPHRFENLLLDSCQVCLSDHTGEATLCIGKDDALDRSIFYQSNSLSTAVMLAPFYMEILALAAIVCNPKLNPDELVIYAAISQFEKLDDLELGQCGVAKVKPESSKGDFFKYSGQILKPDGTCIAKGVMMAFHFNVSDQQSLFEASSLGQPLEKTVAAPAFKSSALWMADQIVSLDPEGGTCVFRYYYPATHPFVKGHFPGKPMMMGVMHWLSVADGCYLLAQALKAQGKSGAYEMKGDGQVRKQDGSVVCDVKGFVVRGKIGVPGQSEAPEIVKTLKVAFRSATMPGEILEYSVHVDALSFSDS